ncbi:uncharacterized protein VP01_9043g1, partial [Puccinia sorghi]
PHLSVTPTHDNRYISSYYGSRKENCSIIWVHVDDGIVTVSSNEALRLPGRQLKGILKIKWNEGISSMVGVKIFGSKDGFDLIQPNLINKILKEAWDRKTVHQSPLPEGFNRTLIAEESGVKPSEYISLIGSWCRAYIGEAVAGGLSTSCC